MPVVTYREAIKSAMAEEMDRDERVVIMGEDIGLYGGTHLVTDGLLDRFGPKRLYLLGLVVFTLASLWCGLAQNVETLIAARVVQGLGAAVMTPQTMAVITRIFR